MAHARSSARTFSRLGARPLTATLAGLTCLSLALTGCSSTDSATTGGSDSQSAPNAQSSSDSAAAFPPVTVQHAFGETTIEAAPPQRVATVGWGGNHEVPLALGIAPVGMSKVTWGGDDDGNGILPWVEDKLTELGAETPVLFDETDGIPYEQVAETKPDVILASYSGLTQEDYDTLSKIAPVVAYPPTQPWTTSMEDMVTMNAKALGKEDEGKELLAALDKEVSSTLDSYPPDLKDKKVLFTSFGGASDPSKVGFYTTEDPRMGFLANHGLAVPQVVKDNTEGADSFWVEVSAEQPELFEDVDLFVSYSQGSAEADAQALKDMQKDPLLSKIPPAIKNGHVAWLPEGPLGAASNESPLSIPATIDDYFSLLNDAAQ